MPLDAQSNGLDCLAIGIIMELLQNECAKDHRQILCRPTHIVGEVNTDLGDWQFRQEILAKDGSPRLLKQ